MFILVMTLAGTPAASASSKRGPGGSSSRETSKLDRELQKRDGRSGWSRVIIRMRPGYDVSGDVKRMGGLLRRKLAVINGQSIELPNSLLRRLASHPAIESIHDDRPVEMSINRAAITVGARAVQAIYGYKGAGVGVAVIDSGITAWHDDLMNEGGAVSGLRGNQRVAAFVDFVNGLTLPYDDNGHGTHVSGIIAGNGYDTYAVRAGIAPKATIISLKTLDANGAGSISNVIAALGWAVEHKSAYNIRVINLSVGAPVRESYLTDPLTLAAKTAVEAGIVVVAAAGNLGTNLNGQTQYGGITAPGNAPWVLTVGASNSNGTAARWDDTIASFSSRGPTHIDYGAKPDLVAPGTGIVSLADPTSTFYRSKAPSLKSGTRVTSYKPYLSLSGTSMAAPVVAGSVALMLEANPSLTPNAVKAILQYTSEADPQYDALTEGAGFLNTRGAVRLARYFATAQPGERYPMSHAWSRQIIWGNQRITGGYLTPNASAWAANIVWGAATTDSGANIVWGNVCNTAACDNVVWGNVSATNIVWGNNVVWGNVSGDNIVWGNNIVWGVAFNGDNIVWGNSESDNIVWGSDCGGGNCDSVIWGQCSDNIVWGNAEKADNIVWGNASGDNVVWGSSTEDSAWASSAIEEVVWTGEEPVVDPAAFDTLFEPVVPQADPAPPPDSSGGSSAGSIINAAAGTSALPGGF